VALNNPASVKEAGRACIEKFLRSKAIWIDIDTPL